MDTTKQVIFKLGNEEFGIGILYVKAIEKYMDIVPIPNAPSYIEGIINLRGDVIPVYSLRNKFGLPKKEVDDNTKLIVTKSKDIVMAFEVDLVNEIVEIPESSIHDAPMIIRSESTAYIDRVADVNRRLVLLLNLDGILSDAEKGAIEKIVAEVQE
ncbi:chemotaxis protein CheW [Anaerosporobacter faecicola]|uniref:chemotaxis protein CheW n=1 Tax=Anaerosporobacter faecicola TaxID=2718714 RepID=UPI00143A9E11|nr:chemotaxis protein CheW [Anaerosporobacter faecicola]